MADVEVTVIEVSLRAPVGLLAVDGWRAVQAADLVLTDPACAEAAAVLARAVPVPLQVADPDRPNDWIGLLGIDQEPGTRPTGQARSSGRVVVCCPRGSADALASSVAQLRPADASAVRLLIAPADPSGTAVLDLVEVMDRLRSTGGCPWDAEQTHQSLLPYLLEESYELVDAVDCGDRDALVEELGDVLLQVVFHARIGQERADRPFDLDQVADGIAAKLRRRHPHVFGDATADTPEQVEANWRAIKAAEKPERTGLLDGIPTSLPPLERAITILDRLLLADRTDLLEAITGRHDPANDAVPDPDVGTDLLSVMLQARRAGVDVAAGLRDALRRLQQAAIQTPAEFRSVEP